MFLTTAVQQRQHLYVIWCCPLLWVDQYVCLDVLGYGHGTSLKYRNWQVDKESHRLWRFKIRRLDVILNPRSMSFPASEVMPHVLCTGTSVRIIPWMWGVRTIILQLDNQVFNSQKGHLDFLFWNHIQNITEDPPFPSLQKWELQLKFPTYIIPSYLNIEVQWYVRPSCILVTE